MNIVSDIKSVSYLKSKASNPYFLPERGRIVSELREYGLLQYREIIIAPWRIIDRIGKKELYMLSVIDSRRNIEDILFKRIANSKNSSY